MLYISVLDLRSQLLYIACKPIYVAVTRQTDEELEELRRNPSRYKSPDRQVPRVRLRSPSVESVYEPTSAHQNEPITIDLEEDDTPPLYQPVATVPPTIRKPNLKRSRPASQIVFVDLCSSDEETAEEAPVEAAEEDPESDSSPCASTDENRDPMQEQVVRDVCIEPVYLRSPLGTPSKLCAKPYVYPADSTSSWLSNLNVEGVEPRRDSFLMNVAPTLKSSP